MELVLAKLEIAEALLVQAENALKEAASAKTADAATDAKVLELTARCTQATETILKEKVQMLIQMGKLACLMDKKKYSMFHASENAWYSFVLLPDLEMRAAGQQQILMTLENYAIQHSQDLGKYTIDEFLASQRFASSFFAVCQSVIHRAKKMLEEDQGKHAEETRNLVELRKQLKEIVTLVP